MGIKGLVSVLSAGMLLAGCSHRTYSPQSLADAHKELPRSYVQRVEKDIEWERMSRSQELESIASDLNALVPSQELTTVFEQGDAMVRTALYQPQIVADEHLTYLASNFASELRVLRSPLGWRPNEQRYLTGCFQDAQETASMFISTFSFFEDQKDIGIYTLSGSEKEKCGGYQLFIVGPPSVAYTSFDSQRIKYYSFEDWYPTSAKRRRVTITLGTKENHGARTSLDLCEGLDKTSRMLFMGGLFIEPADSVGDVSTRLAQSKRSPMQKSYVRPAKGFDNRAEALWGSFASRIENEANTVYICECRSPLNEPMLVMAVGNSDPEVTLVMAPVPKRADQIAMYESNNGKPVELPYIGNPKEAVGNLNDRK